MAFEFTDFQVLSDNLVAYLFGTSFVLGVVIYVGYLVYLVKNGIPTNVSVIALTPLLAAFSVGGWLGASTWALTLSLILLGATTATVLIRTYN